MSAPGLESLPHPAPVFRPRLRAEDPTRSARASEPPSLSLSSSIDRSHFEFRWLADPKIAYPAASVRPVWISCRIRHVPSKRDELCYLLSACSTQPRRMQAQRQSEKSGELSFSRADNSTLVIRLAGDWHLRHGLPNAALVEKQLDTPPKPNKLSFDASELGEWDSGLLTFLIGGSELCHKRDVPSDWSPLPEGGRGMIQLAEAVPEKTGARADGPHASFIEELGHA